MLACLAGPPSFYVVLERGSVDVDRRGEKKVQRREAARALLKTTTTLRRRRRRGPMELSSQISNTTSRNSIHPKTSFGLRVRLK
jgi:hypothetical protein